MTAQCISPGVTQRAGARASAWWCDEPSTLKQFYAKFSLLNQEHLTADTAAAASWHPCGVHSNEGCLVLRSEGKSGITQQGEKHLIKPKAFGQGPCVVVQAVHCVTDTAQESGTQSILHAQTTSPG